MCTATTCAIAAADVDVQSNRLTNCPSSMSARVGLAKANSLGAKAPGLMVREGSTARGYNARWQKARATYLRHNPLCACCAQQGRTTAATVVDHIIPHKGNRALFWDVQGNWQPLCKPCHDRKTATYDSGFGRDKPTSACDVNGMPTDPRHPWNAVV